MFDTEDEKSSFVDIKMFDIDDSNASDLDDCNASNMDSSQERERG
jgi:hypothetical protein